MSKVRSWMYVKVVILSLGLSAVACGLPSLGGGQTNEGASATEGSPASPTMTPLQAEEAPSAGSPSTGSGGCRNVYYPVAQGATWTYAVTGGPNGPTSYTDTISSVDGESFILTTTFEDITRAQRWSCDPDGLVALDFGGASATLAVANLQADFDTTEATGVTLPAEISQGDSWSQTFTLKGTQTLPGDQTADVTGQVQYDATAGGLESVTVSAGTFEALRVDSTSTMNITVQMSGITVPVTIAGTIVQWYAPGVGMVRSIEKSNFFDTEVEVTSELTGYSLP